MQKTIFVLLLSTICLAHSICGQETVTNKYDVRGVIRDQNSAVIPGWRLRINDESKSSTDINGEFLILLPAGDYVLTLDSLSSDKFRAFIKISDKGLNPNYLEFTVDSEAIICSGNRGNPSPKILSFTEPIYPAAARAVRAGGEVSVVVKITQDGKVLSAKAVSGHPLLRRASEVAAEKFLFEPAEAIAEREVIVTFVFLPTQEAKNGIKRYSCPYRIIVHSEPLVIIDTTDSIDPLSTRKNFIYRVRHLFHF